jgi:ssDNA-binding Zn-finger/Zn-ribbon topoisomerase 1
MEQRVCTVCGQQTVYKEGNKNGKPWAAHFCTDKVNCKNVDWVKISGPTNVIPKMDTQKPATNGSSLEMMKLAYRKDLMVALINKDREESFDSLWKVIEG